MKTNKVLLFTAILVLVFAIGCEQGADQQQGATGSQFVGGSLGLVMTFIESAPPREVADVNQPFGISVKIENKGDHDIMSPSDATVTITGVDPADFSVSAADLKQDSAEPLMGASKDAAGKQLSGTLVTLDFPKSGALQHKTAIAGAVTYNVKADVCYKYGSIANTKMCVLEDILGTSGRQSTLCKINEDKPLDKSGAPVQIDSFRESVASANKVAFVFKVKQTDVGGHIYGRSSECDENFNNRDKVHIKIDTGMNDGLLCTGLTAGTAAGSVYEGDATLLNGEREVRCTQTVTTPSDLEKLVRIDLEYDYKQSISQELIVKHLGG
jgi:hypothetical protein